MRNFVLAVCVILTSASPVLAGETFSVRGVAKNDVLNLRAAPDSNSRKIATLPPNSTGIAVTAVATASLNWVKIQKGDKSGWVNAKFLAFENGLPVRLSCGGTEPFWSIAVGHGRANVDFTPFEGGKAVLALDGPVTPLGGASVWLYAVPHKSDFLLLQKGTCSDGMSDIHYPYALSARVNAHFVSGCCR
ncbi:MAG: SH3 domain-containing protein [Proteobacteria bacterium]|nr:SH3 domain-containing protein [Pseudomonadota bacterium]